MFQRLWDVLNKYKAELVVIYSVVDEGNDNYFHRDKPRPLTQVKRKTRNNQVFGVDAAYGYVCTYVKLCYIFTSHDVF